MKHQNHVKIFVCLLAILTVQCGSKAQAADELDRRSGHPYLLYTDANIARLKDRIKSEPAVADAWQRILASADAALATPASGGGGDGGGRGGRGGRRGGVGGGTDALLLAYRMTGDRKYAERVKAILMTQMRPRDSVGAGAAGNSLLDRDPPWYAGLNSGRAPQEFGIAYDTIYDMLTPEERKTLAHNLAENGIQIVLNDWVLGGKRIHSLDTMGHNWWSTAVFGAGVGAMAILDEEPRARDWVRRVRYASDEWLGYAGSVLENKPANFDSAGAFYESLGYSTLAVDTYLPFRLMWNNAFTQPLPESSMLSQFGEFYIHAYYPNSGPSSMSVDFNDSSLNSNGRGVVSLLWNVGYRKPRYLWYLSQFRPVLAQGVLPDNPQDLLYAPTPAELAAIPAQPDLPTAKLYGDMGWTIMRSSWDKDATLLAIKSGFTWNHSHADAGTFLLFHRGKDLLGEGGHSGYSTPEYDGYFRQSVAHNVVTFNGKAEFSENTYFGSQFTGTMSHLLDAGDLRYVLANATGPTSANFVRNFRSFLWIGDAILILDDVKSFEPGQFEFLLHPNYAATTARKGLDLCIAMGDAGARVRPLFPETFPIGGLPTDYPENMRLLTRTGFKPDRSPATYYAFQPAELTRRTKFITALLPEQEGRALPRLERIKGVDYIGVRIRQNGTVTDLYMNLLADGSIRHRNANLVMPNGWETDAYIFGLTYPEGADANDPDAISRTLVVDGSYLRRDGKVVLDSLSKVYLCATKNTDGLDVQLQGQPVINALLRSAKKPAAVNLNGQRVDTAYDEKAQNILLSVRAK